MGDSEMQFQTLFQGDLTIEDHAQAAEFFAADGIIITGKMTGEPTDSQIIRPLKSKTSLPILIGSGVDRENLSEFYRADGMIVGSSLKQNGIWMNSLDETRVSEFMKAAAMQKGWTEKHGLIENLQPGRELISRRR